MELLKVENGSIIESEKAIALFKQLQAFQIEKAKIEMQEKKVKEAILKAMEENNVKSFENDYFKATRKEPTTRITVDTQALKEQGLFELYSKEVPVKGSVQLTWK